MLVQSALLLVFGAVGAACYEKLSGYIWYREESWASAILTPLQVMAMVAGPLLALAWALGRLLRRYRRRCRADSMSGEPRPG